MIGLIRNRGDRNVDESTRGRRAALAVLLGVAGVLAGACGSIQVEVRDDGTIVVNVHTLTTTNDPLGGSGAPGQASTKPVIQYRRLPNVFVDTTISAPQHHFAMGTTPIGAPAPSITEEVLQQAIRQAAELAECYVIRQKIDWEAFRPGGQATPDFTEDILRLLSLARESGFTLTLVELDPIVDRHHVGPLPPVLNGADFSHPSVREALRRQVLEVAEKGRPDYMSLAVEVNGYFESNPDDFENFVSFHKEMYDEIKAVSPDTQVMASFNLEGIQGLLRGVNEYSNHGPQWFLIDKFEPKIDAVAFSTLPFPVLYRPVQLPDDYLSHILQHTDRPIVLSEIGWSTNPDTNCDQQSQTEYLALMGRQALRTPQLRVMAWTILFDADQGSIFDAFPAFRDLGLLTADGTPKRALSVWEQLHDVPLASLQP